jgi:hypothetical protein
MPRRLLDGAGDRPDDVDRGHPVRPGEQRGKPSRHDRVVVDDQDPVLGPCHLTILAEPWASRRAVGARRTFRIEE